MSCDGGHGGVNIASRPGATALGTRQEPPGGTGPGPSLAGCSSSGGLVVVEGPRMADLAYVLLIIGGFALLALTVRGLDSL